MPPEKKKNRGSGLKSRESFNVGCVVCSFMHAFIQLTIGRGQKVHVFLLLPPVFVVSELQVSCINEGCVGNVGRV
jgi:hypothetical protein